MKIRSKILEVLEASQSGLGSRSLAERLGFDGSAESAAAVGAIALFSPDIRLDDNRWKLGSTKGATPVAVFAALENYAKTTGKRIFRVSAALQSLAADQQPTAEELTSIVEDAGGTFELLPNSMIKYKR